jgi:ferredoxin
MKQREEGAKYKYLAAVDPKLCVGCGICIGACDPLALSLHNRPVEWLWDEVVARAKVRAEGQPVKLVFTCERHWAQRPAEMGSAVAVIPLTCVGMALPDLVERGLAAGAAAVQIVGCPPEDCANREGNLWLQRRLERERLPKLGRAYVAAPITTDWLPPNDFRRALVAQSHQPAATAYDLKPGMAYLRNLAAAAGIMLAVIAVTVALSRVPFQAYPTSRGLIDISLNHVAGRPVKNEATDEVVVAASGGVQAPVRLALEVDGAVVWDKIFASGTTAEVFQQVMLPPDALRARLLLYDKPGQVDPHVLSDQVISLSRDQILPLHFSDARIGGDPEAGRKLFLKGASGVNTGCPICHFLEPGVRLVGPSLAGVGTSATTRVAGVLAHDYLHQSIVDPDAYIVPGFAKGQMLRDSAQRLTEEQIQDLVAFLMTLR